MASLTVSGLAGVAAFASRQQRPVRKSRGVQRVCAMAGEEDKKLTFESNKRSALGFVESDSAGQTNIFAVEPKQYVAGSTSDQSTAAGNSTAGAAAIAGTVAAGAVLAGLLLVKDATVVDVGPTGEYLTLTEYKVQFASELRTPEAAPAVADL